MDIYSLFEELSGQKLRDIDILKMYYSAKKIISKEPLLAGDVVYTEDVKKIPDNKLKIMAAINVKKLVEAMPFTVANHKDFNGFVKRKNLGYEVIVSIIYALKRTSTIGLKKKYMEFCQVVQSAGIENTLSLDEFDRLMKYIEDYKYYIDERIWSDSKEYSEIASLLTHVYVTHKDLYGFSVDCYLNISLQNLISGHIEGRFTTLTNDEIRGKLANAKKAILGMRPIKCAQLLSVAKCNEYYTTSKLTGEKIKKRTVEMLKESRYNLEKSYLDTFLMSVMPIDCNPHNLVFVDVTPFYVEDVCKKYNIAGENLYVVGTSDEECDLFELQYGDARYNSYEEKVKVMTLDEFNNSFEVHYDEETIVCISQNRMSSFAIKKLIEALESSGVQSIIILANDETITQLLYSSKRRKEVIVLPTSLNTRTKKQSMLIIRAEQSDEINIYRMKGENKKEEPQMSLVYEGATVCNEVGSQGVRAFKKVVAKKRKKPVKCSVTKDIDVYVNIFNYEKSGDIRGNCYIKKEQGIINDSIKFFRERDKEEKQIALEYINKSKKCKDREISIRDVIKAELFNESAGLGISLKTVWLVEDEIKNYFNDKDAKLLENVIMNSPVGDMNADYYSIDLINEAISAFLKEDEAEKAIKLVMLLASISAEKGYTSRDYEDDLFDESNDYKYGRKNIIDTLGKKSMELNLANKFYCTLMSLEDRCLRVAILMRLLTGIEPSVLCALDRGDIQRSENGIMQAIISKRWNGSAQKIEPVIRENQRRIIPLPEGLASCVDELIVGCDNHSPLFTYDNRRITPQLLKTTTNNILKKLGYEPEIISITDELQHIKKVDLSILSRDPLRTTFSFLARFYAGMFKDEINFLLGTAAETTLANNYVDFNNEDSQKQLKVGLDKVETIIERKR